MVDQLQLTGERLTLPHPRLTDRAFVMIPLAELAPEVRIPGTQTTAAEWAKRLEGTWGVKLWTPDEDDA